MTALFALLACVGSVATQATGPKANPLQPPIPLPIPLPIPISPLNCRLHTDWTPLLRAKQPVWHCGMRVKNTDTWQETICGRVGGRFRTLTEQSEFIQTHVTTGRQREGDGGIGEGFSWTVFVANDFDARLEMEFTSKGPRIVVSATYWPADGCEVALGWSLLSNELVRRHGWYFGREDVEELWFWHVELPVRMAWHSVVDRLR